MDKGCPKTRNILNGNQTATPLATNHIANKLPNPDHVFGWGVLHRWDILAADEKTRRSSERGSAASS